MLGKKNTKLCNVRPLLLFSMQAIKNMPLLDTKGLLLHFDTNLIRFTVNWFSASSVYNDAVALSSEIY